MPLWICERQLCDTQDGQSSFCPASGARGHEIDPGARDGGLPPGQDHLETIGAGEINVEGLCPPSFRPQPAVAEQRPTHQPQDAGYLGLWSQSPFLYEEDPGPWHQQWACPSLCQGLQRLQPHRLVHPSSLTLTQIVVEPLFHNLRVLEGGRHPIIPTRDFLVVAQTAVTAKGDLHQTAQTVLPDIQQRLWAALPPGWKEHIETRQTGTQLFQHAALPDPVLLREWPSELNQTQPAVLWPDSIRSDGRLSSPD